MSFLIGEISALVKADTTRFKRDMRDVHRTGADTSKRTQGSLDGIGRKLTAVSMIATTVFTSALVMGARRAVKEFALLEGAMAKFEVVFGDQSREMEAWVDTIRKRVPLARREIIQTTASMQDLLVPMGIAREEATDMTKRWFELAASLAAFNDVPVDQALEAIRSGIAGQSRPLRQFGIDVRETALQQTALEEGLIGSGEAMNENARQQALLIQAYRQSKDAIDGYEDQLGSTLMMEQELSAQYKDTLATLGQGLDPAYKSLIGTLQDLLNITKLFSGEGNAISTYFNIILNGVGALNDAIPTPLRMIRGLISSIGDLGKSAEETRKFRAQLERALSGDITRSELKELIADFNDELMKVSHNTAVFDELKGSMSELEGILYRMTLDEVFAEKDVENVEKLTTVLSDLKEKVEAVRHEPNLFREGMFDDNLSDLEMVEKSLSAIADAMNLIDAPDEIFHTESIAGMRQEIQRLEDALIRTSDPETVQQLQSNIDAVQEKIKGMRGELEEGSQVAPFFTRTLSDGLEDVLFKARSVEDVLKNIIRQLASRALTTLVMGGLSGGFGAGGFLGAFFGRQGGGNVQGGSPYMVGEQGAEMFVPQSSGTIISNSQLSSSKVVDLNIRITGGTQISGNDLNYIIKEQVRQVVRLQ